MSRLLDLAEDAPPDLARRYVQLAWKASLRQRVRFPAAERAKFCRKCFHYLKPGEGVRTRVRKGRVITTCLFCGATRRRPI